VRRRKSDSAEISGGGEKTVEIAAVRLLARRDHSTVDLKRKLQTRGHAVEHIDRVVDKLSDNELLSDDRFVKSFVAYRGRRGQGPTRIRSELRQQGVTNETIEAALAQAEFDWSQIAGSVRRRKFGDGLPRGASERAKQARFLQYRGFTSDQIRAALNSDVESDGSAAQADAGFDLDLDS